MNMIDLSKLTNEELKKLFSHVTYTGIDSTITLSDGTTALQSAIIKQLLSKIIN